MGVTVDRVETLSGVSVDRMATPDRLDLVFLLGILSELVDLVSLLTDLSGRLTQPLSSVGTAVVGTLPDDLLLRELACELVEEVLRTHREPDSDEFLFASDPNDCMDPLSTLYPLVTFVLAVESTEEREEFWKSSKNFGGLSAEEEMLDSAPVLLPEVNRVVIGQCPVPLGITKNL